MHYFSAKNYHLNIAKPTNYPRSLDPKVTKTRGPHRLYNFGTFLLRQQFFLWKKEMLY